MDKYEKLMKLALKASEEQELPDAILAKIKKVYEDKKADENLLNDLINMLSEYEPFSDVGCGSETYSTKDIENLLKKLA